MLAPHFVSRWLAQTMPGITLLRHYPRAWWAYDWRAGISVAAVAIPVGVAYAQLAGMSPVAGLYASILPLLAYALFGSSRQLIVGPDAATCAMIFSTLAPIAAGDAALYVSLSVSLALLTGLFCLIASRLRLGFLADFLSPPILAGFLNGVAISIVVGQLGKVLGFNFSDNGLIERLIELPFKILEAHPITAAIGLGTLLIQQLARRLLPSLPSALVAMVMAGLIVFVFRLDQHGVSVIGALPAGLPTVHWPVLPYSQLGELLGAAAGLALISFSSAMLTARSFAAKNRYDIDADREFTALGMANIAAGFSQGFAISGADSRTAVNDAMGGKSQMVSIVAALTIAIAMLLLTPALYFVPIAALGAVLITASLGLMNFASIQHFRLLGRGEWLIAIVTLIGVACVGVMQGMLFAVLLSTLRLLIHLARPHEARLGVYPTGQSFHDLKHHPDAQEIAGLLVYRFESPLNFFNANFFRQRVLSLVDGSASPVKWVVIDVTTISQIDAAGEQAMWQLQQALAEREIRLALAGRKRQIERRAQMQGQLERVKRDFLLFSTLKRARIAYENDLQAQHDLNHRPEGAAA
ncbi:SulP family inorganic anion transporter [Deefgea piscis]|uniref:SulP family inorganic anion transporter n=1 Tax=Deefgea piscis TaxID=2739061 RepID=UPI001C80844B|nr:SulP family inorganic anion transporter [Deefgea piscis]QZA82463.1 SulP family inorganic anion transporter [Deefgea piscis]